MPDQPIKRCCIDRLRRHRLSGCGNAIYLRRKMTAALNHANLVKDWVAPHSASAPGGSNDKADFESWRVLLCSRLCRWLHAWDHPHTLDCPACRCADSRTDGDAHHVRGNRSRGTLGGSVASLTTHGSHEAWFRFRRARLIANHRIHRSFMASRSHDSRVPCRARPSGGNGVSHYARGLCSHAATCGSKMRFPAHIPRIPFLRTWDSRAGGGHACCG